MNKYKVHVEYDTGSTTTTETIEVCEESPILACELAERLIAMSRDRCLSNLHEYFAKKVEVL